MFAIVSCRRLTAPPPSSSSSLLTSRSQPVPSPSRAITRLFSLRNFSISPSLARSMLASSFLSMPRPAAAPCRCPTHSRLSPHACALLPLAISALARALPALAAARCPPRRLCNPPPSAAAGRTPQATSRWPQATPAAAPTPTTAAYPSRLPRCRPQPQRGSRISCLRLRRLLSRHGWFGGDGQRGHVVTQRVAI